MKYIQKYHLTLIEPLILSGKDKTEISLDCLDYIPGNIILGLVAGKLYDEKNQTTNDLFHNGNVQFGNAYLSIGSEQLLPIPAVWYTEKGKNLSDSIYYYHKINWEDINVQIKQEREGYFRILNNEIQITKPIKDVVLKSAYDRTKKSALAEQMYLYEHLVKSQTFIFEVKSIDKSHINQISEILLGNKHIAKSKTSEFGNICIKKIGEIEQEKTVAIKIETSYLIYAKSNLAFINEYGEFTWSPSAEQLGFQNSKINYEKSQLHFDHYHIRNGKRKTHDSDRLIIKKGSVFVIEKKDESDIIIDKDLINVGLGVFLSEGYGQIMINPPFIDEKNVFKYNENKVDSNDANVKMNTISNVLQERFESSKSTELIYKNVSKFINTNKLKYKAISSNQWGTIRTYIYQSKKTDNPNFNVYNLIFNNESGYLYTGKMSKKWVGNIEALIEFLNINIPKSNEENEIPIITDENIEKLLLLSIEMPKHNRN